MNDDGGDDDRLLVGRVRGTPVYRTTAEMLQTTLFQGASRSGKTNLATLQLRHLLVARPTVPIVVLDGAGTLFHQVWASWCYHLEGLEEAARTSDDAARALERDRDRVVPLLVEVENRSGVALDITRLRPGETVKERVKSIVGLLAHQRADSEVFNLVYDVAPSAFACLVAAGRPVSELRQLLALGNGPYWAELKRAVHASGALTREAAFVGDAVRRLEAIFKAGPQVLESMTGSTNRMFRWLSIDLAPYFERPTLDLTSHLGRGGVLLARFKDSESHDEALMKRALFGAVVDVVVRRDAWSAPDPLLTVIDEHTGLDPATYAGYLARSRNLNHVFWFLFQSGNQIGQSGSHYDTLLAASPRLVAFRAESQRQGEDVAVLTLQASVTGRYERSLRFNLSASEDAGETATEAHAVAKGESETDGTDGWPTTEERRIQRTVDREDQEPVRTEELVVTTATPYGSEPRASRSLVHTDSASKGTKVGRGQGVGIVVSEDRISYGEQVQEIAQSVRALPRGTAVDFVESETPQVVQNRCATDMLDEIPRLREAARRRYEEGARRREASRPPPVAPLVPLLPIFPDVLPSERPQPAPSPRVEAPRPVHVGTPSAPATDAPLAVPSRSAPTSAPPSTPAPLPRPAPPPVKSSAPGPGAPVHPAPERPPEDDDPGTARSRQTFTPAPLAVLGPGGDRDTLTSSLLGVVATLRYGSVQTVMALSSWGYDKAHRSLERLREAELVERFQLPAGREKGSTPSLYVLTGSGASLLAPTWPGGAEELHRLVRNVGARRRDVEEGKPTNLQHALSTAALFALLVRHARSVDPTVLVDAVRWDRGLSVAVDVGLWLDPLTARERLLLSPEIAAGTSATASYVPDLTLRLTWQPPGYAERITEVLMVEVETGLGGRDYDEIGAVKGAKIAALLQGVDALRRVGPIPLPNPKLARVLFHCGTAHVEDGIRAGLRRALGSARRPIVTTNASLLPLATPSGALKKDLLAALDALAGAIGAPVWKWYRDEEGAPRFGYPRVPRAPR